MGLLLNCIKMDTIPPIEIKVYPCSCIQMDTKTWIAYILFVHKYIYARIEIKGVKGIKT